MDSSVIRSPFKDSYHIWKGRRQVRFHERYATETGPRASGLLAIQLDAHCRPTEG